MVRSSSQSGTAHNTGLALNLAINYGGRTEIVDLSFRQPPLLDIR